MDSRGGDGLDGDGTLRAEQPIEGNRAYQVVPWIDDEHFVEAVRQVLGLAHIVDRLADRPERRYGDEIGLHDAAGRVLGIFQAPLECRALERRQLGEDVRLLV